MDYLTLIGGVCTGGLAATFFNHSVQRHRRPRLHLVFDPGEPGCEVETGTTESAISSTVRYLRVKLLNSGRSSAENSSVSITRISFASKNRSEPIQTFREEVLDLKLSMIGDRVFRVAPGAHRFLDLCLTRKDPEDVAYGFYFDHNPVRLTNLGWGPGAYSAELFASADEAPPRRAVIKWSWDGTFGGLRAEGLGYMY